jgi:uncharacterized membrane protein
MTNGVTASIVRLAGLLLGGIFAGFLVTVLVLESTLRGFDAAVYTQVRQVELVRLDDVASATLIPTLTATALLVAFAARTRGPAFWPTLTALVLLVTVFVTSLVFNIPINQDQVTWNVQAPPPDWASVRDRWQVAHAVRTAAALLAFGCLSRAAMLTAGVSVRRGGRGRGYGRPVAEEVEGSRGPCRRIPPDPAPCH